MERLVPWGLGIEDAGIIVQHLNRYTFALNYTGKWSLPVLDAACGSGFGLFILSMRASDIIGVDKSYEALGEAEKIKCFCPCRLIKRDLDKDILPNPFLMYGAVTSFETIEHLENPEFFLKNVYNSLWDEGYFVFSIPRTGITPFHVKEYNCFDDVRKVIEQYFIVEKCFGQSHQVGDCDVKDASFWYGVAKKRIGSGNCVDIAETLHCTKIK